MWYTNIHNDQNSDLPNENRPITNWKIPVNSASTTAYVGSLSMGDTPKAAVMRDMMAVGPRVMSLEVPMRQ